MAVGFGFSITDVCNAFRIVRTSIRSLDDRHGAAPQYAGLLSELDVLQNGMSEIDNLLMDKSLPPSQSEGLRKAVALCLGTMDDFLESTADFQPHLTGERSGSVSTRLRKVQWSLCRDGDVKKFKVELERHVSSVNMLLLTLRTTRDLQSQAVTRQTERGKADQLDSLLQNMTLEQRQFFSMIVQQNQELLRSVQDLRSLLGTQHMVPPQILLQPPVVLLDPLGRIAPFHLEFVDSLDCFVAVMRARFSAKGISQSGLRRLDEKEFSVEDSHRKRPIDVSDDWPSAFRPGQHVDMRMRYHRFACPQNTCPSCLSVNESEDLDACW